MWEIEFIGVVSEGTVLAKVIDCLDVGGGPSTSLIIWTLFLQRTQNALVNQFAFCKNSSIPVLVFLIYFILVNDHFSLLKFEDLLPALYLMSHDFVVQSKCILEHWN